MKRVIYIEPKIDNYELVNDFFKQNNSDSSFVNPHICLVFPFETSKSELEITKILNDVFKDLVSFNITLSGLTPSYEKDNNFLFLDVIDEENTLLKYSKTLYEKFSDEAVLKGEYTPHITIGKSSDLEKFEEIKEKARNLEKIRFDAVVSKIYCKSIKKDDQNKTFLDDEVLISLSK